MNPYDPSTQPTWPRPPYRPAPPQPRTRGRRGSRWWLAFAVIPLIAIGAAAGFFASMLFAAQAPPMPNPMSAMAAPTHALPPTTAPCAQRITAVSATVTPTPVHHHDTVTIMLRYQQACAGMLRIELALVDPNGVTFQTFRFPLVVTGHLNQMGQSLVMIYTIPTTMPRATFSIIATFWQEPSSIPVYNALAGVLIDAYRVQQVHGAPCTVTVHGLQERGVCDGTFTLPGPGS